MTKLDPQLRSRLRAMQARATSAEARASDVAEDAPLEIIVEFTGELADLTTVGFSPLTVSEHPVEGYKIAPGTVPVGRLQDLVAIDHVVEVGHPRQYRPLLDYSLPEIRANAVHNGNPSRKGSGVVIGVIDSGIDWRHGDFIAADGQTSRIVGIWDQLLTPQAGETTGAGGVGVVYNHGQLNQAVQGTLRIRTFDTGIVKDKEDERSKGHGTHVAGIAAGDGSMATCCHGANTYVGVAPLASIIMVRSNFSESRLIAAIDFILNHPEAAGKPVVINMSLGGTIGPHDGTEDVELHIDSRVTAQAGRAIVVAAGNSGDVSTDPCHVAATVPGNGSVDVEFTTPDGLPGAALVDVWYARAGSLNARLTSPDSAVIGPANHGADVTGTANPSADADRQSTVDLDSTINGNHGRDNNLLVIIAKPTSGSVPVGSWILRLTNPTATPVPFHAWTSPSERVHFLPPLDTPDGKIRASAASTVESPGTAAQAITVANHQSKTGCCNCFPATGIVPSSSRGPVARGAATNPKPNIAAPGLEIAAASADAANLRGNCCDCCPDACCCLYEDKTGTSMAAPHVTGAIALMLEEKRTLTKADILRHLTATAREPGEPNAFGAGKLDAQAAVLAVRAESGGGGGGGGSLLPWPSSGPQHHHGPVPDGFLELRRQLSALPDGEVLAAAASRHFSEVRRLINTQRRVATMWHRAGGPRLLRGLLHGDCGCCTAVGERELRYLERFIEQLEVYGSPRLRAALARHRSAFVALMLRSAAAA